MNNLSDNSRIKAWLPEPVSEDVRQSLDRLANTDDVQQIAVMPDVHLAGEVCNGTVVATKELIYPLAVGSDLGCGMLAVGIDLDARALASEQVAGRLLVELYRRIPTLKHVRSKCLSQFTERLEQTPLSDPRLERLKRRDGLLQMGTLGRGNHFVEFQIDPDGRLWLMLHSGSRGMGQAISEHHMRATIPSRSGIGYVEASSSTGRAYVADIAWAIDYANQNRLAMGHIVETILQEVFAASVNWSTLIHCHHNHVRQEVHSGETWWVHRKGALSANDEEAGVIPGSMGTRSYHIAGRGSQAALRSSSHGAGRRIARHAARVAVSRRDLQRQLLGIWYDQRMSERLRDEAPAAYKDIGRVMRAQRDLVRIVRQLRPILIYKGI